MKNIDLFYNTGFDIINIPCSPDLLYREYNNSKISFSDFNLIQTDWLGEVVVELSSEDARNIDYCIITDDDNELERSCYIVDHFEMLSNDSCKLILILDPYNTMGGFEPGSGNIVINGSAERISVPLIHSNAFPTAEDNTFFTLDEPFQPSNRLINESQQLQPSPYVPPIPPTPGSNMNSIIYYVSDEGTGSMDPDIGSGIHYIQYCTILPAPHKKFSHWLDEATGTIYVPGGAITLDDGVVLTLKAVWITLEVEAYNPRYQAKITVGFTSDNNVVHWNYTLEKHINEADGFRVEIQLGTQSAQPITPYGMNQIDVLNIDDASLQAILTEIKADMDAIELNQKQRNAMELDYGVWLSEMGKFFMWINNYIVLNSGVENIDHISIGSFNMRVNTGIGGMMNDSVWANIYSNEKIYPMVGYPYTDTIEQTMWSSTRADLDTGFTVINGTCMINFYKDQYFTDHRCSYKTYYNETPEQKDYTIPTVTTVWPDETRTLASWNTKSDGSGISYQPGAVVRLDPSLPLELYPIWSE